MGRRAAPGAAAVVGISIFAVGAAQFGLVALGALGPELERDLGLSRVQVGLLPSFVFIGCMVTSLPAGRLTDSWGVAPVLCLAMVGFSLGLVLAAASPSIVFLLAAAFVMGLGFGGIQPPTNAVVAGSLGRRRGFYLSLKQSGVPLGGLLAGAVLPRVAVEVGWRVAFVVPVVALLLAAALAPILRRAAVDEVTAFEARPHPLRRSELAAVGVFGFVLSGSQWTLITYLALYLTERHDLTLAAAGAALAVSQAAGAGGRLLTGWMSDGPGRRLPVLLGVAALSFVSLVALASGVGGIALWAAVIGAGVGLIGWNGAYSALLTDLAGPGRVGRVTGDALVFLFAGVVVLPPTFGFLSQASDAWWPLWLANAVAIVLSAGLVWRALGSRPRPAASLSGSPVS